MRHTCQKDKKCQAIWERLVASCFWVWSLRAFGILLYGLLTVSNLSPVAVTAAAEPNEGMCSDWEKVNAHLGAMMVLFVCLIWQRYL